MHFGAIILIIWIIRYFASNGASGGPSRANDPPTKWFIVVFLLIYFIPLTSLLAFDSLTENLTIVAVVGFLLLPVYCIPSWYAQITIRLGWVKISYWLGRLALGVHYRDPFSGGLFYAWRAIQNLKPEQRQHYINWLEQKVLARKKTLRSGTMVMRVFLKSATINDAQSMESFRLLHGCNKQLIPGNISRYACRYMLARDLPTGDWQLIARTATQWHGVTFNPLASWLLEVHYNNPLQKRNKSRVKIYIKYLIAGLPRIAKHLPDYKINLLPPSLYNKNLDDNLENKSLENKSFGNITLDDLKSAEWWLINHNHCDTEMLNKFWQKFISSETTKSLWLSRIQELGSFNSDEIYQKLVNSVANNLSARGGSDAMENDSASQERDRNFQLLQIKIRSVTQRVEQNKLMTGIQEFEEWMSIAALAKKIGSDKMAKSQVFYTMRSPCWNWVAKLWNGKDKPLGFLISSFLSPDAHNDKDAYEFFNGIITNRYK